jgi:hypothetical protein
MNAKLNFTHGVGKWTLVLAFVALIGFSSQPAWAQRGGGGGRQGSKQRGSQSAMKGNLSRNYKTSQFRNTVEARPVRPQGNSNAELQRRARVANNDRFAPKGIQGDKAKWEISELDGASNQSFHRPHIGDNLEGDPDQPIIIGRNQSFLGPHNGDYSGNAVVASEGWDEVPEDVMFPRARKNISSSRKDMAGVPGAGNEAILTGAGPHLQASESIWNQPRSFTAGSNEDPSEAGRDRFQASGDRFVPDRKNILHGLLLPESTAAIANGPAKGSEPMPDSRNQPRSLSDQDREIDDLIGWDSRVGVTFDSQTRPHTDGIK